MAATNKAGCAPVDAAALPSVVRPMPGAASAPVANPKRRGRLPAAVSTLSKARLHRKYCGELVANEALLAVVENRCDGLIQEGRKLEDLVKSHQRQIENIDAVYVELSEQRKWLKNEIEFLRWRVQQ